MSIPVVLCCLSETYPGSVVNKVHFDKQPLFILVVCLLFLDVPTEKSEQQNNVTTLVPSLQQLSDHGQEAGQRVQFSGFREEYYSEYRQMSVSLGLAGQSLAGMNAD